MFKDRLLKEEPWSLDEGTNIMWNGMPSYIRKVAREVLGESRGSGLPSKHTWWWNEEVQKAIRPKRECYKCLHKCRDEENIEKYKLARKEAKKAVREARGKAYKDLHHRLGTKEGEKNVYKLTKMRERKSRNLNNIKCIKDEDQRLLVKENEVKERWRSYFDKLFNGEPIANLGELNNIFDNTNRRFVRRIRTSELLTLDLDFRVQLTDLYISVGVR
ncbi:uncharacterized protein LOC143888681 [Tasmannia lanceolata]|uniref:uncharacterized protein LOC143888681 n=1 Tax=Tasmannia lanceolata TaxID=3420 RepID=UPI0040634F8E